MSRKGLAGWTATLRSGFDDYWDDNTRPANSKSTHGKILLVAADSDDDGQPCPARDRVRVQKRSKTVLETDIPDGLHAGTLIGLHGANRQWLQRASGVNTVAIEDESRCVVVHAATQRQAKQAIRLAHGQFHARHDRGEALASSSNPWILVLFCFHAAHAQGRVATAIDCCIDRLRASLPGHFIHCRSIDA